MAKALVLLANGFEEIEALTAVDVLRRGGIEVVTASIHDSTGVRGAHGVSVKADATLSAVASAAYEAIILPGGGEGTENLRSSEAVLDLLRYQKGEGRLLCAICAAPTVLVEAGVLDPNQHVTCYPSCQMELDRPWVNQPVVVHGDVITGQAPGTSLLFALVVLKTLAGGAVASRVAREMVADIAF